MSSSPTSRQAVAASSASIGSPVSTSGRSRDATPRSRACSPAASSSRPWRRTRSTSSGSDPDATAWSTAVESMSSDANQRAARSCSATTTSGCRRRRSASRCARSSGSTT